MGPIITVACEEVQDFSCDVLVLKYAQALYGADLTVAGRLGALSRESICPIPGGFTLLPGGGRIAAGKALFVGVVALYQFDYGQIREFAARSLRILSVEAPDSTHIAMTMHGVGYGLDEREAFLAQIAGIFDAYQQGEAPDSLQQITIVERNQGRARRLKRILESGQLSQPEPTRHPDRFLRGPVDAVIPAAIAGVGEQSSAKPHIFVAMPFNDEMEDVFVFGIQAPVNAAGYLCERVDMAVFTGDILERIKNRIETAVLVIADLTGANANVYLEVGYAWGKNKPTLLLARNIEELRFDVRSHRCIAYKNITDLARKLEADLAAFKACR